MRIPTLGNCLKAGRFSFQDLGDRAVEGISNLLPPPLGLDQTLEQNATAIKLLDEFSEDSILAFKASLRRVLSCVGQATSPTVAKPVCRVRPSDCKVRCLGLNVTYPASKFAAYVPGVHLLLHGC